MMTISDTLGFLTAILVLLWRIPLLLKSTWFPTRTIQRSLDEDMSLLQLAEAFATRIGRERAMIAEKINNPETIRDVSCSSICFQADPNPEIQLLAVEHVISPAHHAFLEMLNPIRPAHRLPREILMQIFANIGSGKRILPVSHVCRRWRDTAINAPELWSFFETEDFTSMFPVALQRSKDNLLNVQLHASCEEIWRLERLLELPFSRLRSLDVVVTGPFTDEVKGIFSRCRSHASVLNEFSLRFDFDASIPQPVPFDENNCFSMLFDREAPVVSALFLRNLHPWPPLLSERLKSLTLTSIFIPADELYPALRSVPNLETLALLNAISVLSENFSGSDTPIALDRLRVLYIHQPRGALKHLNHLFAHITIPRLDLACIFMSDSAVVDDDIPESSEQSYRMFKTVTELVMHLDSLPESQFYLYGVHEDSLAFSFCLPTVTIPRIFNTSGLSMGAISANVSQVTRFILRGDDSNSSVSADNLFYVFRCLPELETLVVTGMPLDNVVAALNRLRDNSESPVLRRLRYLYTRGIGENSLPLTRFLGQRLEPELPVPQIVCQASLKNGVGMRYGDVRAIEDLKPGEFPKPFSVPERMQKFLKTNLETVCFFALC
jgi:F-box-like